MTEIQLSAACFDEIARKMRASGQLSSGEIACIELGTARFTRISPGRNPVRDSVRAIFPIALEDAEITAALTDQGNLMRLRQRLIDNGFSVPPGLLRTMLHEAR